MRCFYSGTDLREANFTGNPSPPWPDSAASAGESFPAARAGCQYTPPGAALLLGRQYETVRPVAVNVIRTKFKGMSKTDEKIGEKPYFLY
jgi:hypothetical protein